MADLLDARLLKIGLTLPRLIDPDWYSLIDCALFYGMEFFLADVTDRWHTNPPFTYLARAANRPAKVSVAAPSPDASWQAAFDDFVDWMRRLPFERVEVCRLPGTLPLDHLERACERLERLIDIGDVGQLSIEDPPTVAMNDRRDWTALTEYPAVRQLTFGSAQCLQRGLFTHLGQARRLGLELVQRSSMRHLAPALKNVSAEVLLETERYHLSLSALPVAIGSYSPGVAAICLEDITASQLAKVIRTVSDINPDGNLLRFMCGELFPVHQVEADQRAETATHDGSMEEQR